MPGAIRGTGLHALTRGSRSAIAEFAAVLKDRPDDLGARWLMNIACMTLGEYPDRVPAGRLIPPKTFASEYDIKRFYDVAPKSGVAIQGHAGGAILEDFDGDGFLDVMLSSMGWRISSACSTTTATGRSATARRRPVSSARPRPEHHPRRLRQRRAPRRPRPAGWLDEAGGRYPHSLLRNNGDGTFEDTTERAGVLALHPTQTGAWGDYDNDGRIDLFIGDESMPGDPHPSELYHNNGDGTFTDRSVDLGNTDFGYVKGVAWGDFDNDGRRTCTSRCWAATISCSGTTGGGRSRGPAARSGGSPMWRPPRA